MQLLAVVRRDKELLGRKLELSALEVRMYLYNYTICIYLSIYMHRCIASYIDINESAAMQLLAVVRRDKELLGRKLELSALEVRTCAYIYTSGG